MKYLFSTCRLTLIPGGWSVNRKLFFPTAGISRRASRVLRKDEGKKEKSARKQGDALPGAGLCDAFDGYAV